MIEETKETSLQDSQEHAAKDNLSVSLIHRLALSLGCMSGFVTQAFALTVNVLVSASLLKEESATKFSQGFILLITFLWGLAAVAATLGLFAYVKLRLGEIRNCVPSDDSLARVERSFVDGAILGLIIAWLVTITVLGVNEPVVDSLEFMSVAIFCSRILMAILGTRPIRQTTCDGRQRRFYYDCLIV